MKGRAFQAESTLILGTGHRPPAAGALGLEAGRAGKQARGGSAAPQGRARGPGVTPNEQTLGELKQAWQEGCCKENGFWKKKKKWETNGKLICV